MQKTAQKQPKSNGPGRFKRARRYQPLQRADADDGPVPEAPTAKGAVPALLPALAPGAETLAATFRPRLVSVDGVFFG